MQTEHCPKCDGSIVTEASVGFPPEGRLYQYFILPGLPSFHLNPGVGLSGGLHYCLSCGHLWTHIDPKRILEHLRGRSFGLALQYYQSLLDGPYRDLPDYPEAREAADKVAEMDELIIQGRMPGATRRYRDLTNATWDQALAIVASWPNLKRAKKLELFGWAPKGKTPADAVEKAADPMRDRWLDG